MLDELWIYFRHNVLVIFILGVIKMPSQPSVINTQENESPRERADIHGELQRIKHSLIPLHRDEGIRVTAAFFSAVSDLAVGTSLVAQGTNNIQHGHTLAGAIEVTGGIRILNQTNTLDPQTAHNQATIQSLTARQWQLQKRLYDLEKAEALRLIFSGHYLQTAIVNQFNEIDEKIATNHFSPIYIDIAINTQCILKAQTPEAMNSALDKHNKLAMSTCSRDEKIMMAISIVIGLAFIALGVMFSIGTLGGGLAPTLAFLIPGPAMVILGGITLLVKKRNDDVPLAVEELAATEVPGPR